MAEWHIPPDYIVNNWTDELLDLMITCLNKRKERERKILSGHSVGDEQAVSDTELFGQLGNKIKVVKHGN